MRVRSPAHLGRNSRWREEHRVVRLELELHFSLALVETALYRDTANRIIVQPRVLQPSRGPGSTRWGSRRHALRSAMEPDREQEGGKGNGQEMAEP